MVRTMRQVVMLGGDVLWWGFWLRWPDILSCPLAETFSCDGSVFVFADDVFGCRLPPTLFVD